MKRNAAPFTSIVAMVACLFPTAHGAEQVNGFIYAATDKASNMAIVIDAGRGWVDMQDKASARIGSPDGSLGGFYEECGNEAFYCVTGALEMVIPKAMPMREWKFHGLSCQSTPDPREDVFRIACRSPKHHGQPTYTYSLTRGVVSIESAPVWSSGRFQLRGERGLFASGN